MDSKKCTKYIHKQWNQTVVPKLVEYVAIPNVSPAYDPECFTNGLQEQAMQLLSDYVRDQNVQGLTQEVITKPGRTPLLFIEVAASEGVDVAEVGTIMMYGHMDKQPPFEGWDEGLHPYKPVIRDGKLYGRGGADDGYSTFCAITSLKALQKQGAPHGRVVILIEASEESGSPDLEDYVKELAAEGRIGTPNLIICLDSGAGNYDQLWITSSLRGVAMGTLNVEIISEGVHSGDASGVVPDTFRIARSLLDRIENPITGEIKLPELYADMSEKTKEQVRTAAKVLGAPGMVTCFPFLSGAHPVDDDSIEELAFNRWWRPQLTVVGAAGLPDAATAGNVLRPKTSLRLSVRLPPTVDCDAAQEAMRKALTENPPYGAKVTFTDGGAGPGWAAPPMSPWLEDAVAKASDSIFNKPAMYFGEGGSIPFMGMLGEIFPQAQFVVTGVLGPGANAHGPNEFLHIEFSEKLTCCISSIVSDHCTSKVEQLLMAATTTESAVPEGTGPVCPNCSVERLVDAAQGFCSKECELSQRIHDFNQSREVANVAEEPVPEPAAEPEQEEARKSTKVRSMKEKIAKAASARLSAKKEPKSTMEAENPIVQKVPAREPKVSVSKSKPVSKKRHPATAGKKKKADAKDKDCVIQ